MPNSIIIVACFVLGVIARRLDLLPQVLTRPGLSTLALYLLMLLIGLAIGLDQAAWTAVRRHGRRIFLVPVVTTAGTAIGVLAVLPWMDMPISHGLAVGFGLGYYSLASVLIGQWVGGSLAVTALLANVTREILTLLLAPALRKLLGPLAPIASGGATAMDTTLPVILRSSGPEYVSVAVFSGVVLTLLVPFLVLLALKI